VSELDKEALKRIDQEITEFAELLYAFREASTIKTIKENITSFLLANHYAVLPEGEPPSLSDEEIVIVKDCELEAIGETDNYFTKQRAVDRAIAKAQRELCKEWDRGELPKNTNTIDNGFGNVWSAYCPICGKKTMSIVRPGKVQCSNCGSM